MQAKIMLIAPKGAKVMIYARAWVRITEFLSGFQNEAFLEPPVPHEPLT